MPKSSSYAFTMAVSVASTRRIRDKRAGRRRSKRFWTTAVAFVAERAGASFPALRTRRRSWSISARITGLISRRSTASSPEGPLAAVEEAVTVGVVGIIVIVVVDVIALERSTTGGSDPGVESRSEDAAWRRRAARWEVEVRTAAPPGRARTERLSPVPIAPGSPSALDVDVCGVGDPARKNGEDETARASGEDRAVDASIAPFSARALAVATAGGGVGDIATPPRFPPVMASASGSEAARSVESVEGVEAGAVTESETGAETGAESKSGVEAGAGAVAEAGVDAGAGVESEAGVEVLLKDGADEEVLAEFEARLLARWRNWSRNSWRFRCVAGAVR